MMKIIIAFCGFRLSQAILILILGSFSSAAFSTEQVFRELAEPPESTEIEPAALQAGAEEWWQARMQQDVTRREYHETPAAPAPLRKALAAGLRGSEESATALDCELLQSPNRTNDLRTY